MSPAMALLSGLGLCVCFSTLAEASVFLGRNDSVQSVSDGTLLSEIEDALGERPRHFDDTRLRKIEKLMNSTFAAMPKTDQGTLGHAAVRYMLHRFFLQQHGWVVGELHPASTSLNDSSPTSVLEGLTTDKVQALFESRVGGDGLSLHEVSLLAATIEHLVHDEAMHILRLSFQAAGVNSDSTIDGRKAKETVENYMAAFLLGGNFSALTPADVQERRSRIGQTHAAWPETRTFLHEIQQTVHPDLSLFTFSDVAQIVEQVGDRYGRWQDYECKDLKKRMMKMESAKHGRVHLSAFYRQGLLYGQFAETEDYLRYYGALDDRDPQNPEVIIPNYIGMPSNCISASSYYSVCCLDECEELLNSVEKSLGRPDATPADIVAVVSVLPSSTMKEESRSLPPSLLGKLDDVANHHGGLVPLHGRLFAQWMHHAYPRECTYPQLPLAKGQWISPEKWDEIKGEKHIASEATMWEYISKHPQKDETKPGDVPEESKEMWTMDEYLVVSNDAQTKISRRTWGASIVRGAALVMAAGSVLGLLAGKIGAGGSALHASPSKKLKEHMV